MAGLIVTSSRPQHTNRDNTTEIVLNPALFNLISSTFPMQNAAKWPFSAMCNKNSQCWRNEQSVGWLGSRFGKREATYPKLQNTLGKGTQPSVSSSTHL
jgi:hypothetical protein